jgi:exosome complex exonuclease DIS3/RRP44
VVLLSDDKGNLERLKAAGGGVLGWRMVDFAKHLFSLYPSFSDIVSRPVSLSASAHHVDASFEEHKPLAELERGVKSGKFLLGTLRTSGSRQQSDEPVSGSVFVTNTEEHKRIAVIGEENLNRAVDSDRVALELLTPETGRVVGIMRKNWRACAGTLVEPDGGEMSDSVAVFVPIDPRFPFMRVYTSQFETLRAQRVVVQMDGWEKHAKFPSGHLVKSLGPIGEKETETNCTLFEYDIPFGEFSSSVLDCLPASGKHWKVENEVIGEERIDLRDVEEVCSVDRTSYL